MKKYLFFKNILDIVFAVVLLVLLSPVMIVAAVLIKLDSKGPVIFCQKRPGKNGKIFYIYKFRTMRIETEKNGVLLSDFDRMTKIGNILRKTSIDELPQLVNIIKGEMSFIGPRPLLVSYLDKYTSEQRRRHEVKPGITGWAQVNGRNAISWEEKFTLDIWYIDNLSIMLDLKILLFSVKSVLSRGGINNTNNVTMPSFDNAKNNAIIKDTQ